MESSVNVSLAPELLKVTAENDKKKLVLAPEGSL